MPGINRKTNHAPINMAKKIKLRKVSEFREVCTGTYELVSQVWEPVKGKPQKGDKTVVLRKLNTKASKK